MDDTTDWYAGGLADAAEFAAEQTDHPERLRAMLDTWQARFAADPPPEYLKPGTPGRRAREGYVAGLQAALAQLPPPA